MKRSYFFIPGISAYLAIPYEKLPDMGLKLPDGGFRLPCLSPQSSPIAPPLPLIQRYEVCIKYYAILIFNRFSSWLYVYSLIYHRSM